MCHAIRLEAKRNERLELGMENPICVINIYTSRLGGVVVSVLATSPTGSRLKPRRGNGFLRAIKICSTSSD
jgi:hypothetical protein